MSAVPERERVRDAFPPVAGPEGRAGEERLVHRRDPGEPSPAGEPGEDRTREEQLVRRLDWRFLLDDPAPGRVAYGGDGRGDLLPALRRAVPELVRLGPATGPEDGAAAPVDLAVLEGPGEEELRAAREVLREGGWLYCEADRGGGLPGLLRRAARGGSTGGGPLDGDPAARLRELGFVDVRCHAHHPDFERCREIVPTEPAALALGLRRHAPWLPGALVRLAARAGARWLPRFAPRVSVVARRPAGDGGGSARRGRRPERGAGTAKRAAPAGRQDPGPPWPGPPALAVTPRFRASGHVLLLVPEADGCRPKRVVKVARRPGRSGPLAREADNLRSVHAARPGGFEGIPRPAGTGRIGGFPYLVETGLGGRPVDRSFVRRRPRLGVRSVVGWLVQLHRATARRGEAGTAADAYRRLVEDPLDRLGRRLGLERDERDLVEATRRLTGPLAGTSWPTVFEHGDLSHPNLLLGRDGRVGVVDWEAADPQGLPAADLFFFLAYVAFARHRAEEPEACVRAFERTFFRRSGPVERAVERYAAALELPADLLLPLFLATWPRQVARQMERVAPDGSGALDAGTAGWLRRHRFFALWRHAVAGADRLELGAGADRPDADTAGERPEVGAGSGSLVEPGRGSGP